MNIREHRNIAAGAMLLVSAWALGTTPAASAEFPSRPIRILTSETAGGANFAARVIADSLSARLGQPVIVENRGGGVIAGEIVARAQPDGHTLIVYGNTLWLLPLLRRHVPYDPLRDFAPIALVSRAPAMLVVHPSVAAHSVKELIALARANPETLNYASGAGGGISHLAAEMFGQMAGIRIVRIPFKGTGPALNALMGNHVQLMFVTWGAVASQVRAGQLRALAVTSAERTPLAPQLPTLAESGLPGYESTAMFGILGPAKMPAAVITRLNREIGQVLGEPAIRDRFTKSGAEAIGGSPEQFAKAIRAEVAKMGKIIAAAGIREE